MNNEKKNNISLILSIAAFIMLLSMIVLWFISASKLVVVGLDSFVGVIVALLAIIVTIVLGWQIYNAIEIKEKLKDIESFKEKLNQQEHRMEQMYCNICHSHGYAMAHQSANINHDFVDAFRWLISSLRYTLILDSPINVEKVLEEMLEIGKRIPIHSTLDKEIFAELDEDHRVIINTSSYECIKSRYMDAYKTFKSKVMPIEE